MHGRPPCTRLTPSYDSGVDMALSAQGAVCQRIPASEPPPEMPLTRRWNSMPVAQQQRQDTCWYDAAPATNIWQSCVGRTQSLPESASFGSGEVASTFGRPITHGLGFDRPLAVPFQAAPVNAYETFALPIRSATADWQRGAIHEAACNSVSTNSMSTFVDAFVTDQQGINNFPSSAFTFSAVMAMGPQQSQLEGGEVYNMME
jgi:hypothetical protein